MLAGLIVIILDGQGCWDQCSCCFHTLHLWIRCCCRYTGITTFSC